eukprot:gene9527-biopygen9724
MYRSFRSGQLARGGCQEGWMGSCLMRAQCDVVLWGGPLTTAHTAPRSLQAACGDPQVRAKRNGQGHQLVMLTVGVRLCQGAPSLLGPTYIAAHGPSRLVIGSRKQWGVAAATALNSGESEEEARSAAAELLPKAEALCPALNANWQVERVRSGVRAVPPRTPKGALPLVGLVQGVWGSSEATGDGAESRVWMHVGLGARGLVYHAWIARHLSKVHTHKMSMRPLSSRNGP